MIELLRTKLSKHRDVFLVLGLGVLSRLLIYGHAALINTVFGIGRAGGDWLCSWDCAWYQDLAQWGYHRAPLGLEPAPDADGHANWAFFPLFPIIVRALMVFGGGFGLTSQVLNNVVLLIALVLIFEYVKRLLSREDAWFVVALFAFSPFSLYFSVPYTESLYLVLMMAGLLAARQGAWLLAGLSGAALSATRNVGVFIAFSYFLLAIQRYGFRPLLKISPGTERVVLACVLCGLGLFAYMTFLQIWVGDALAFSHVQAAWGGELMNPLKRIMLGLKSGGYELFCALSLCAGLLFALILVWFGYWAEALILALGCLIPAAVRLVSAPRYVLTLFPVYLAMGLLLRGRPMAQTCALMVAAGMTCFFVASWMTGRVAAL